MLAYVIPRAYCARRGVHKTTGDADDFKSNGRVERAVSRIKQVKQVTRSLLINQHLGREYWPLAMWHAAARLRQKALQCVGHHSPPSVLPFGTNVHIKRRSWDRRKDRWSSKALVGRVKKVVGESPQLYARLPDRAIVRPQTALFVSRMPRAVFDDLTLAGVVRDRGEWQPFRITLERVESLTV